MHEEGMKLYVMRHGPAEDDSPTGRDADRALTASGRERVRSVAKGLLAGDEAPALVVSSPLVRAIQTAEIVVAAAKVDAAVEVRREMGPSGHALALVGELFAAKRKRVMVVGHEPDLSMLVQHLLVDRALEAGMQKAMVVGLKLAPGGSSEGPGYSATLRFVLDPKTLVWQRE
jgi:phosphohistidine phosphatase